MKITKRHKPHAIPKDFICGRGAHWNILRKENPVILAQKLRWLRSLTKSAYKCVFHIFSHVPKCESKYMPLATSLWEVYVWEGRWTGFRAKINLEIRFYFGTTWSAYHHPEIILRKENPLIPAQKPRWLRSLTKSAYKCVFHIFSHVPKCESKYMPLATSLWEVYVWEGRWTGFRAKINLEIRFYFGTTWSAYHHPEIILRKENPFNSGAKTPLAPLFDKICLQVLFSHFQSG